MKILVIGSNSFSGSNFSNFMLEKGYDVTGISRSREPNDVFLPYKWGNKNFQNFKFFQYDLNVHIDQITALLEKEQFEYVINFSAQGMVAESWENPTHWYHTNVVSQVALHDSLRKQRSLKRYIHVSTPEAYGSSNSGWVKENYNFSPSTPYAVSRASCDLHLLSFFNAYDFPVIFTSAANVYGPGQHLYRIIPRAFLSSRLKRKLPLHGGGGSTRSFIHIRDVIHATYKILKDGSPGETYHISTNEIISIKDLVNMACKITNRPFEDVIEESEERLGKDQSYLLDSSKLRNELNWTYKISLEDGLIETLEWLDTNIGILKSLPVDYVHKQ